MEQELDFIEYYSEFFRRRVTELRMKKGVSERELSLSIGRNESFLNHITNGHALPTYESLLEICEYLEVTPGEFFDPEISNPGVGREILSKLNEITDGNIEQVYQLIRGLKPEHYRALIEMLVILCKNMK